MICLILLTAYLLYYSVTSIGKRPKKPPQRVSDELETKSNVNGKEKKHMTSSRDEETRDDCDKLIARAGELMQHGVAGYDAALDMLAWCALQNESHAAARWNMAVILIKAGRNDKAIYHMQAAVEIEPHNVEYLRGTGLMTINSEMDDVGVVMLERYCELTLGVDSFYDFLHKLQDLRVKTCSF